MNTLYKQFPKNRNIQDISRMYIDSTINICIRNEATLEVKYFPKDCVNNESKRKRNQKRLTLYWPSWVLLYIICRVSLKCFLRRALLETWNNRTLRPYIYFKIAFWIFIYSWNLGRGLTKNKVNKITNNMNSLSFSLHIKKNKQIAIFYLT